MSKFTFILSLSLTFNAWALTSPFASSVPGISIGNTHEVTPGVLRGSQPGNKIEELKIYGIQEVIIFKSQTKDEVDSELALLKEFKIKAHHIPFRWKDLASVQIACEQTIEALNILRKAQKAGRQVFFHCTVGEDRTGLLAGLWKMEQENLTLEEAYQTEMCERGYADGNSKKPWAVARSIHQELTPLFVALAQKMAIGEKLTAKICADLVVEKVKMPCKSK